MGQALVFLLVCVYASLEGVNHAVLWSRKGANAFKWNEHVIFSTQRIVFILAMTLVFMVQYNWIDVLVSIPAYPFFHNGFYYLLRKRIDGSYPNGFLSEPSKSSSATINFSLNTRASLLALSLVPVVYRIIVST